jgi:hypothetical protein
MMTTDQAPANFRWLEEGRIAGSGLPERLEQVDWLYDQGVRAVVSFHPVPAAAAGRMRERGIEHLSFPIRDFVTPIAAPLASFFTFVDARAHPAVGPPRPVLFH